LLLLFVATTVLGALIAPHPVGPQPSALGDFSVPTAEQGRAIPIIFGTCMIKGGNTVWWGDLKTKKVKTGGGILTFGMTQVVGYQYFLGCQFMLCRGPVDELVDIQADAKSVNWTPTTVLNGDGSENYIDVEVDSPNLFGGTKAGGSGGVQGSIDFYRGVPTQQPDAYLSAKQGRVVISESTGLGYLFSGVGNGTIGEMSGGASSKNETITITAIGIDTNDTHGTYLKMHFSVVGSISGSQSNSTENSDGSTGCWADQAFSCPIINFIIHTGSTQFQDGDAFTIETEQSQIAPAYPELCYAAFKQFYFGTSNYLKPIAFVVRRCPDPLDQGAIANISGDANPAFAIYEILTSDYGLSIDPATVDATAFIAAAETLAAEGLGISMQFDTQATADQLISEILRHCDGLVYVDPATGLWEITLARGGYDPSTLPELTVDSILGTPDFSRGSWEETSNRVGIKYIARAGNFTDALLSAYDPANIAVTQEVRPQTIEFKGISNPASAALVAIRVLKTFTYPLAKLKVTADRSAWTFRPGGLFRFTWTPLGIADDVFRITRIGYGELTDGKITIDAVEDIFGINSIAFVSPPPSGWVNPLAIPPAPVDQAVQELPYDLMMRLSAPPGIYEMALCARGDPVSESFQIWRGAPADAVEAVDQALFIPGGNLVNAYPAATAATDETGFIVASLVDADEIGQGTATDLAAGSFLALIDDEILAYQGYVTNEDESITLKPVMRGVLDTVPGDHAAGAAIFFFDASITLTKSSPEASDLRVEFEFCPENDTGALPVLSATPLSITTRSRYACPYPPGNLTIAGNAYGVRPASVSGDLVFSWSSRNRLTETAGGSMVAQDAADIAGEAGQTFAIEIWINSVLIRTVTPSGETFTYTAVQRGIDNSDLTLPVTFNVFSVVGGVRSYFPQSFSIVMTGATTDGTPGTGGGTTPPVGAPTNPVGDGGTHIFAVWGVGGAGPGTITGLGTPATEYGMNQYNPPTGPVDLEVPYCPSDTMGGSASLVLSLPGNGPRVITSITAYLDVEVIENDLNGTGATSNPGFFTKAFWASVGNPQIEEESLCSYAPGAGAVARTTLSASLSPGIPFKSIQMNLAVGSNSASVGGVHVRIYGAWLVVTETSGFGLDFGAYFGG
jgi:hypothetical protein